SASTAQPFSASTMEPRYGCGRIAPTSSAAPRKRSHHGRDSPTFPKTGPGAAGSKPTMSAFPTSYNQASSPLMIRIAIADAGKHIGETVEIAGWLYNLRRSGKIAFPILRDGYGTMQCVAVKANLPEELFETIKNLTQESSIIVTGKIRPEQRAPGGYGMGIEALKMVER